MRLYAVGKIFFRTGFFLSGDFAQSTTKNKSGFDLRTNIRFTKDNYVFSKIIIEIQAVKILQ